MTTTSCDAGVAMALTRLGARPLAEGSELLGRPAERDDALDRRDGRTNARDLSLGLMAAADDAERACAALREMTRSDAARRTGPKLPEPIGLDHGDELRGLRVEQADDERRAVRRRRVELPAGEPEPAVRRGHVRERALGQSKPAPRGDLDLTRGHPPEARLDRLDRVGGRHERRDVGLRQIQRHARKSRKAALRTLVAACNERYIWRALEASP